MRKDAALLVLLCACLLALPSAARAGTYDVVACNAPGANGENLSWTLEPYNSGGKAAPDLANFVVAGAGPTKCTPTAGINFGTVNGKRVVKLDDGAGWTFRAPAGTTVKRVQIWRSTAARASQDDPATPGVENGWWNVTARAGDSAGGRVVIGAETCLGNSVAYPGYCRTGGASYPNVPAVTYEIGEPVISWGLQCAGQNLNSLCLTGDGTTNHAGFDFQAARVTVEDLVAPEIVVAPADVGFRRPSDPFPASATDSAGIGSLRVLVDGVERIADRRTCDYRLAAPCPGSVSAPTDLVGIADGRHTVTTIAADAASNLTRIERTVDLDGTPPVVSRVPVSGRKISAVVSDALSGVAGGTIEIRRKRDAPFVALKTTLKSGRLNATVPKSVKGSYGIRVSAGDKAGNGMSALVTSMSLSTRVGKGRSRKVRNERATIGYGRPVTVLGRLTSTDGSPIANQAIVINGTLRQTGATAQPIVTAMTDTGGRFSVTLPAGPSRTLSVVYPGATGILTRTREVALRVPASATIHAAAASISGSGSVRFNGRLRMLGTTLPPGGKLVDLQASQGGRWSTVATTRATGSTGSWHAIARFRGTPGTYPVRLRIRREALFPYELGYSASVPVRVR